MQEIKVSKLFIYPIKSTKGISLQTSIVEKIGLKYDRVFAILDENNKVITARENPKLLRISSKIDDSKLGLSSVGKTEIELNLKELKNAKIRAKIFRDVTDGKVIEDRINEWITEEIEEPSKLMQIDNEALRKVKEKNNGKENDTIGFSDAAPIHLISEASLQSLNEKLETAVTVHHFRPNIVVKGCEAFEEDNWKTVRIGSCVFEKAIETERCSLITINPNTIKRSEHQEPLRTLAQIRGKNNSVNFGIYLIPRKLGTVNVEDKLEFESN